MDQLEAAIARLERAVARLEAAAAQAGRSNPPAAREADDPQLREVAGEITGRLETAVARIDRVLGGNR
jgi:hypothetical protein